ncbi:MAG: ComF family protein [Deltaproteobacteria bacterium]|nr:ComF family protein [Deltaproteobacteria bacterium]
MFGSILNSLLDIIAPHVCHICGRRADSYLCKDCVQGINLINDGFCTICGIPFISKASSLHVCGRCIKKKPKFTMARSIGIYEDVLMDAVHKLKYNGKTSLAKPLGLLMAEKLSSAFSLEPKAFLIVPVPLHKKRLKERGFNQSLLLAREVAKTHHIHLDYLNFKRIRYTEPQINLKDKDRLKNVKGAFSVKDALIFKGKKILLIDDVYTTGATVTECVKVLKKAGAKTVHVFTLARVCRV